MNEYLKATIELHCYLVNCGKPCSNIAIQHRYDMEIVEASKEAKFNDCKIYMKFLAPDWTEVWIYKKDFMLEIIKALPDKPKTNYDHWVLGKAFGYSDDAIEEFLRMYLTTPEVSTIASGAGRQSV